MKPVVRNRLGPVDVRVEHHGSLYGLRPMSLAAREWIDAYLASDALSFGGAVMFEPRYVGDVLLGMRNDGLVVQ